MKCLQIDGDVAEQKGGRFAPPLSVPSMKEALMKAAYDPRIRGIHLKVGSVSVGWARLQVKNTSPTHFAPLLSLLSHPLPALVVTAVYLPPASVVTASTLKCVTGSDFTHSDCHEGALQSQCVVF